MAPAELQDQADVGPLAQVGSPEEVVEVLPHRSQVAAPAQVVRPEELLMVLMQRQLRADLEGPMQEL